MDARQEYKNALLDCKKYFKYDSSNILSKCINSHDQKNFWVIWKKRFMYKNVNINMLGCSNYTEASEKLTANFIANMNDSANSLCYEKLKYQRNILNGYDQIVFSAGEVKNVFCKLHLNKADGLAKLPGNHLKFAFDILHKHAVNLFNLCIKHAYIPK